jgi:PIN domain nuclease of toxin-antitoxin system
LGKESIKVVLDKKPLIKLFAKEEGRDAVQKILSKIEAGRMGGAISVFTPIEIYCKYLQEKRPDLAKTRTEELRYAIYLKKIDINEEVAVKAGEFRANITYQYLML